MFKYSRPGALAVIVLFVAVSALPADAQHRSRPASGTRTGSAAASRPAQGARSAAAPRQSQAARPAAAPRQSQAARPAAAPRQSQGARPANESRPPQGPGPAARPRPPQTPPTGRAVPRPPYRPGAGYPGYRPGYRPGYGYGGYYPRYYWGFGAYYGPYYYSPWLYSSFWYYPSYYPYGYGYDYGPGGASLKVEVKPTNAEVYIDGHLAGIVDQFDGMFQSLSVEPGGHEVTIYLEGFRSIRQQLYLSAGSTYRIKGALEQLAPGEPNEERPQAAALQYEPQAQLPPPYPDPQPQGPPPDRPAPEQYPPAAGDSRFGQVAIRVQPGDAEVFIDGEAWRNPAGADRLVVNLTAGTHRVEIRKEGFDAFVTAIEIRRGETTALNVSLSRF